MDFSKIKMINAGAGSGKTFTITEELFNAVDNDGIKPSQVFATTFTNKAAQELVQRVRTKFLEKAGESEAAKDNALFINEARIGTLHSLCAEYLQRFAFDLGLSPDLQVLDEVSAKELFNQATDEECADNLKAFSQLGRKLSITSEAFSGLSPLEYAKKIAAEAIANGIGEEELSKMGELSWSAYNDLLNEACGTVDPNLTIERLTEISRFTLNALEQNLNAKNQSWFKNVKSLTKEPAHQTWASWDKLDINFPQKALPFVEDLEAKRARLGRCSAFRADIESFIKMAYGIAQRTMVRYRELKQDKGVVDFADLEKEFLSLLKKPQVLRVLEHELDLLMVDEFQDTNPMQLAIYLKLTKLVSKTIFVGDIKQAIYGFRGSDPELMKALQATLEQHGNKSEKLGVSRRSTQTIVEFCNRKFGPIYGDDACLEVWDKLEWNPPCNSSELFSFNPEGKNNAEKLHDFSEKLKLFVSSAPIVLDKETETGRPMHWGDIGILTKSNNEAKELTRALLASGVPAQFTQDGLMEEPEVVLALALMSIVYSKDNKIAHAEVRSILRQHYVDEWLSELLFQQQSTEDLVDANLQEVLEQLQSTAINSSPKEILTAIIFYFSLPDVIRKWDSDIFITQQRLANLDALYALIDGYEKQCVVNSQPVTFAGLNKYFSVQVKDKKDVKGMSNGRAVSVMTIHKAKGLEWPCVILSFMQKDVGDRFFGVSAQMGADQFNIDDPLDKRWVRFLPPFSSDNANGHVKTALKRTEVGVRGEVAAREEAKRLLYVAYTRARNYLGVINMGKSKETSYESLLSQTDEDFPDISEKWRTDAEAVTSHQLPFVVPERQTLKPRYIQPSTVSISGSTEITEAVQYGQSISLPGVIDTARFGNALHRLIGFLLINQKADATLVASKLFQPFGQSKRKIKLFIEQAASFVEIINEHFKPEQVWVEMPVNVRNEHNQIIKGSIDLLIETDAGYVIVDHKLKGAKTSEQQQQLASKYIGQLATYKEALQREGYTIQALALNLFNSGTLLGIETK